MRPDGDSLMTLKSAAGKSLRPDGQIRSGADSRLLSKYESKRHELNGAKKDLETKTAVWTPLYYGQLPYHLCFAAGGSYIQFYAIERTSPGLAVPVGPQLVLTVLSHRAQAAVCAVNYYRLLACIKRTLPTSVLPVGDPVRVNHPSGYSRSL